jgi:hypothetical protein
VLWSAKQKKGRTGADQKREKYSLFIAVKAFILEKLRKKLHKRANIVR